MAVSQLTWTFLDTSFGPRTDGYSIIGRNTLRGARISRSDSAARHLFIDADAVGIGPP